jgi:TPP-dependent 2-oxoacid decarboxylase
MRRIREGCFNVITQWNYGKICELVRGGESAAAATKGEFDAALSRARNSDRVSVIELKIPRNDVSQQLARIAREVRKIRGMRPRNCYSS